jgi:Ca2+:H+ antiporter
MSHPISLSPPHPHGFLRTVPKPAYLVLFLPASVLLAKMGVDPLWVFLATALTIVGLTSILGKCTEQIAHHSGVVVGGLLNASFGNFPELIISINAIRIGMADLVRASWVGSIIGNVLLIVGLSMILGGSRHKIQKFSRTGAATSVLMLLVALFALFTPSFIHLAYKSESFASQEAADLMVGRISLCAAGILLAVYALYLLFSLVTHHFVFVPETDSKEEAEWPKWPSIAGLFSCALVVSYESGIFVDSIRDLLVTGETPFNELFMGVIFVAAVSNAVAAGVSLNMARKNKMDLVFNVAIGASVQIALLVAPALVIFAFLIGKPLPLTFTGLEITALLATVAVSGFSLLDGECNWFEGVMYVALYLIMASAFFFHP